MADPPAVARVESGAALLRREAETGSADQEQIGYTPEGGRIDIESADKSASRWTTGPFLPASSCAMIPLKTASLLQLAEDAYDFGDCIVQIKQVVLVQLTYPPTQ